MKPEWVDFLQKLTEGQQRPVPDHIWTEVQHHLPGKSRKRIFGFWIWLGMGLLLCSAIYFVNQSFKPAVDKTNAVANLTYESKNDFTGNSIQGNSLPDANAPKTESVLQDRNARTANQKTTSSHKFHPSFDPSLSSSKQEARKFSLDKTSKTRSEEVPDDISVSSNDLSAAIEIEKIPIALHEISVGPAKWILPELSQRINSKMDCYQFGKKKVQMGLEAFVGPAYSPYHLNQKRDGYDAHLRKRIETESIRPGLTAGIRWVLEKGKWAFKTGLEYQLFYEQLNHRNPDETRIISVYRGGKWLYSDTLTGVRIIRHHNYHHLFNIPFAIQYDWNLMNVNGGILVGGGIQVFGTHSGKILDSMQEPADFGAVNGIKLFDRKIIPFVSLHIPVRFKLTNDWLAFVEPGVQFYLKPFTSGPYPLEQSYTSYQIRLGLHKNF